MTDWLRGHLKVAEGFRLKVYDDATGRELKPGDTLKGNPTIGVGRALNKKGLSPAEVGALLENDMADARRDASTLIFYARLTPARKDVIAEMCFNLGLEGLREFKKMIEALMREDYMGAANQMLCSRWAGQVGPRAALLAHMMRTGEYPPGA